MKKISQIKNSLSNWRKKSLLKVLKYTSLVIGAVIFLCVLIFIFFPDPFINAFLKDRITKAFTEAYPAYSLHLGEMHYNVWNNRLECDTVGLESSDSTFTCSAASFSVSGVGWLKILMQSDFNPNTIKNSVIDAQKIVFNFREAQDELRLKTLHISAPDSQLVIDSIKYYSLINDEQFFAKSKFRQTRYRLDIPQLSITGLDYLELLQGNIYKAKNISIHEIFADILVNMDKPYDKSSSKPKMPNEIFTSMREILIIDSVKIINGQLKYCERYAVKANPGVIKFSNVNVSASGIANFSVKPDTAIVHAEGLFMNSATMKLFMAIPLTSPDFSFRYSGTLSKMDLTELNAFIENAEHRRVKSGVLHSANYDINVNSGHANGTLRVVYKDLSIAVLDDKTGSEDGILDVLASFIGKVFIIRGSNIPDENGLMKIGEIKYTRNPDDYFLQFVWFALRSGVGNVVGF